MKDESPKPAYPSRAQFATTRWSVVLAAGNQADSHCAEALQTLCETYWVPLYAYARKHGYKAPDAEDLTQSFLIKVIEKNLMRIADRERGRFRSFLLTAFKNFISDQRSLQQAQKRGGQARIFSLDFGSAETRYQREPAARDQGDAVFERQWAMTVLETVMKRLRERYEHDGKMELFEALQPCLVQATKAIDYTALAQQLALKEGALRVAVHRLRKRYRNLLRYLLIGHPNRNAVITPMTIAICPANKQIEKIKTNGIKNPNPNTARLWPPAIRLPKTIPRIEVTDTITN